MPRYLIGLGSSMPNGAEYIQRALLMTKHLKIHAAAPIITSPPAGGATQFPFVNSAIAISTSLSPDALWFYLHSIEHRLGRIRLFKNGPRTLDLDILWCDVGNFKSAYLTIPHSEFFKRKFVLKPAMQAAQLAKWPAPR